jgi:4-amino-4-deoxy-L-arabinose transferase-like glycosyltransferase
MSGRPVLNTTTTGTVPYPGATAAGTPATPATPTTGSPAGTGSAGPPPRPWWSRPALAVIAIGTAVLYLWNLSINGYGNAFYAAAVKSGTVSWKAFFFGSLDPGSFITVDKPPAAFWVQEISARIFGFSSWAILAPEALAGVVAVVTLHHVVRRWAGDVAAILAAAALALTPVAALMFRFNNPDAILTMLMVLAAAALWKAVEGGQTRWLVIASVLVGLAFTTKMLQGWIILPALTLTYLICGPPRLGRRIVQLLWAGLALVIASGWWVAIVELWPKDSRPYIDNSTNNSELNLIFGYNGFGRIFGQGGGKGGGGGFGGGAGWTRMFSAAVGGQVAWLIPLALLGLVAGFWVSRRGRRTDPLRAGFILWGMWTLTHMAVFSKAQGIFHPYYTVALAPGVAALAGAGAVTLWRISRGSRWWAWLLPAAVAGSAVWSAELLARTPTYDRGLGAVILGAGALGALALLVVLTGITVRRVLLHRVVAAGAGVVSTAALLAGPTAFSLTTINTSQSSALATAGPASAGGGFGGFGGGGSGGGGGFAARLGDLSKAQRSKIEGLIGGRGGGGGGFGGGSAITSADRTLVKYLDVHRDGAKFIVAGSTSMTTDGIILASGQPVITIGGFDGQDPAPTLAQFEKMVRSGQVRYLLVGGGGGFGGGGAGGFGGGASTGGGTVPAFGDPTTTAAAGDGAVISASPRADAGAGFGGGFGGGGRGTASAIDSWVEAHGTAVPASASGSAGTLYLITPAEAAAAS